MIARHLRELKVVEAAYVKPAPEPARRLDLMPPRADEPPARTPDFTPRQGYLDAAPGGIDARFAWTQPGGDGVDVQIIDIEGAWRFTHEDLLMNQGGVMGGTQRPEALWRNHGTAVCGEIAGDRNGFGVTGICPQAGLRAISFDPDGSAPAIVKSANALRPGDIILIEMQRAGPRATGIDQQGLIAIEWWSDDLDAIRYATNRGVIVVEAAGNGAEDLDDPAYDAPEQGFAPDWVNPFRRAARDSGAILVGAGAPPENTHGRPWGPDRSRLDFSNFGSAIDAQGWGEEVTTCGYGDLQGGIYEEDRWYTDMFNGTSSASPIVVGAIACLQGVIRARGLEPLTPAAVRELLRTMGSPQQDAPGPASQRIGNRPDLRQLIAEVI